ncbi:MAG: RNHCP domain-containing protein [Clostridia bacterium]|nr:RNHCP domain-containing protein [Clostridia bacterium]MDD4375871.1 RNHCP domain-containing protein [Clostridia bacterium]
MFIKNDNEFICKNCNKKVEKLKYTSRDHCNYCLYSVHVDIYPGDRQNECKGLLEPINVLMDSKKGKQIIYKCKRCNSEVKNIVAEDDKMEEIYKIVEKYAKGSI